MAQQVVQNLLHSMGMFANKILKLLVGTWIIVALFHKLHDKFASIGKFYYATIELSFLSLEHHKANYSTT